MKVYLLVWLKTKNKKECVFVGLVGVRKPVREAIRKVNRLRLSCRKAFPWQCGHSSRRLFGASLLVLSCEDMEVRNVQL